MLSFVYTECHKLALYAEGHYAESLYAECHYAECIHAEGQNAECLYAECHYAECRGALLVYQQNNTCSGQLIA
jgi:hypothetical protein